MGNASLVPHRGVLPLRDGSQFAAPFGQVASSWREGCGHLAALIIFVVAGCGLLSFVVPLLFVTGTA